MIELFIWLCFGMLNGWVAYLASRPSVHTQSLPYFLLSAGSAIIAGYATKDLGSSQAQMTISLNPNNLFVVFIVSIFCALIFGFFNNIRRSP